ncbi:MAG: VWA domain-containing protein [Aggregatilineales bacterium]
MTTNPDFDNNNTPENADEQARRWRLILGGAMDQQLQNGRDQRMDSVLQALYGDGQSDKEGDSSASGASGDDRQGGTEESMPDVSRWLGDIRKYFPDTIVQIMQRDAIEKVGLKKLLSEPEILQHIKPDVELVATLMTLKEVIPGETKASARILVQKVVEDLMKRLESPMRQAIRGALNRATRNRRPRHHEINWHYTIRTNLKHYQKDYETIIPETLMGYGRRRHSMHDVIICIDQSGSMASSIVYASVFGAVMASLPSLRTHMVVFDTSVVDLTPHLSDPVDVLFGTQLGGGTDINRALGYCQQLIVRPEDTTFVLISDLFEGGDKEQMIRRTRQMKTSGVQFVSLLALNDTGTPAYDYDTALEFTDMDIPAFACTPDLFPELMAATMNRQDINAWAGRHAIKVMRGRDDNLEDA